MTNMMTALYRFYIIFKEYYHGHNDTTAVAVLLERMCEYSSLPFYIDPVGLSMATSPSFQVNTVIESI